MERLEQIDYVLVNKLEEKQYVDERWIYEKHLRENGLGVEEIEKTERERYIKIVASKETLLKYCEIMKLRMPLKNEDDRNEITEQYSRNRNYLFEINSDDFISPSIKSMIINFILEQTKYKDDISTYTLESRTFHDVNDDLDDNHFGITKLLAKNAYEAAYPLHEDEKRQQLINKWGMNLGLLKFQPLHDIKTYFGIKIALYFAWLEFYNVMLAIASFISVIYFFVGILLSISNKIGDEICYGNKTYYMCPQCDKNCDIWDLKEICPDTTLVFILNNSITIVYGVLMALWSAIYLNMWNQYSAKIIQKWGVIDGEDMLMNDVPTEEYLRSKINKKTCYNRFPNLFWSFSVVLFWVCIVFAVLVGMTFYRISLYTSEWLYGKDSRIVKSTIVEVTGAILDLISILVLNEVYSKVAYKITKQELHRTQKQFEESLMWKFYVFWFVNYYSSFFYIAFIKGRFGGTPHNYKRIYGYRQEECSSKGCIAELFIQMAVVMLGDMTFNNFIEYGVPYIRKKIRAFKVEKNNDLETNFINKPWIRDYKLLYWGSTETSMEYLEMVLQYGLVILFVTAFPLGPVLALLNNLIEIRMDARNIINNFRRPVAQNVKNIGVWMPILEMVVNLSVITNACLIAFTTNFIPELVYQYYGINQTYVDFSLSRITTNDLDQTLKNNFEAFSNITECRYLGYYNPPEHPNKYELSEMYWHILAGRLVFILLFQNFVSLLKTVITSFIPPMPKKLKSSIIKQLKRTQRLIILEENRHNLITNNQLP